jgi:CheY-like chemotaxis protein
MDIRLPGIDGVEALRRLRAAETTRAIPVLAMTASVMTADRQKILEAGFDGYQSKPINVTEFVAAVAHLLARLPRPSA